MSPFSKFASWLPQAGFSLVFVVGALSLPEVTQTLRIPIYRAWNSISDPGQPPSRVLYLKATTENPSPELLKTGIQKLLQARPAAIAMDGRLVGLSETDQGEPWSIHQWLPSFKNAAPIIVGFPWSMDLSAAKQANQADQLNHGQDLPPRVRIKAPLQLKTETGLLNPLPMDWQGQVSAGYLEPKAKLPLIELSLFRRMSQGLAPSLGVETLKRALRLPDGPLPYVDGVGALLGKNLVLPFSTQGTAPLALYHTTPMRTLEINDWSLSALPDSLLRGNVIFVGSETDPKIQTYRGPIPSMSLAAHQVANMLGRNLPVSLPSAKVLTLGAGLVLALLAVLGLVWFGKAIGFALAVGLSLVFPGLSLVFFLASHWWVAPEFPFLAVWAGTLPFLLWPKHVQLPRRIQKKAYSDAPAIHSDAPAAHNDARVTLSPVKEKNDKHPESVKAAESAAPTKAAEKSIPPSPLPAQAAEKPSPPKTVSPAPDAGVMPLPPASQAGQAASSKPATPNMPPMADLQPAGETTDNKDVEYDAQRQLVRLGRYKIIRKMGQGSAGEVYEAIDLQMGRRVAVKTMIQTAQLHFDRAFERFLVEARAAGSLNHPNINTIHDFGSAGHISYMVLEYLDGMTLSQWMKSHPMPTFAEASPWIEQIASALDYAHAHKVIHRDLKPSNLMVVTESQQIKLLDFGVAKFGDVMLTRTGMTVGTPTYMSPEQLQGLKVGPGSDQYTLAVLVYQLLTYKLPYAGQKIPEICNRILKGEFIPIRDAKPEIPTGIWMAMERAFSRNPDDRYSSCSAFHQALHSAMKTADTETVMNYGNGTQV